MTNEKIKAIKKDVCNMQHHELINYMSKKILDELDHAIENNEYRNAYEEISNLHKAFLPVKENIKEIQYFTLNRKTYKEWESTVIIIEKMLAGSLDALINNYRKNAV